MNDLSSIIELAKAGGSAVGPIFALLWFLERRERVALYKQFIEMNASMRSMNEAWLGVIGSKDRGGRR